MNAFRRQLSASGWQAVGFFGSLAVFAAVAVFWGSGIESDLDRVIDQRRGDHKVIRQLVERARVVEVRINPNPSKATTRPDEGGAGSIGAGDGQGGGAPEEDPAATRPPEPGDEEEAETEPVTSTPAATSPSEISDTAPPPPSAPETTPAEDPGPIQSTVNRVDDAITPTVCGAAELLRHLC